MAYNPFIEDAEENALFTLKDYKKNITSLTKKFSKPGYFNLSSITDLKTTVFEVNIGIKHCREYVVEIGSVAGGIDGLIQVIWKTIPTIRKAIGGENDLAEVRKWEKQFDKSVIPVSDRKEMSDRAKANAAISDILKDVADIRDTAADLQKVANEVADKLNNINMEIEEVEKKLEEERRRAEEEELRRQQQKEKEKEKKQKELDDQKCREEEERKIKEEKERKRKEKAEQKRKEEEEERKHKEEKERKRKEKAERKQKEAEEKRRLEEEERLRREEEDRMKKEEEDRMRLEEEEKRRKEEEEKQRIEEEERQRKEEEERRRVEEEDRRIKEEEEERMRLQEEERKRREEAQRQREEELRKQREYDEKRRNPDNWHQYVYSVDKHRDHFQNGVGCILREPDGTLEKDKLTCDVVQIASIDLNIVLGPLEECVSNVINLKQHHQEPFTWDDLGVQLSIPYMEVDGPYQQAQVYVMDGSSWKPVLTHVTMENDINLAHFRVDSVEDLTFFVAMVPVTITRDFDVKGGMIQAPNDPKVSINVRKKTFTESGEISLKVIPKVELTHARSRVSAEHDGCLVDASSLVYVTVKGDTEKALLLDISFPTTEGKLSNNTRSTGTDNNIHVMTSPDGNQWIRNDPDEHMTNYSVCVALDQSTHRVILLRTKHLISSQVAQIITRDIQYKLKDRTVNLVVRQCHADPGTIYVQCCTIDRTDALLKTLSDNGYTEGPLSSKEFNIREGGELALNFRNNIEFADPMMKTVSLTYMTSLQTAKYQGAIRVVDEYKQRDQEYYRGVLQVWTIRKDESDNTKTHDSLVDEVPLSLPKQLQKKTQYRSSIYYGTGPLHKEYMYELSSELGDEWRELADNLGVSAANVQLIIQRHSDDPGQDMEHVKFDMLRTWHMRTMKGTVQVDMLMNSMKLVGRHDLAMDLDKRNKEYANEKRDKAKRELFREAVKAISYDQSAVTNWKDILKELGIHDDVLTAISDQHGASGSRACLLEGILTWSERKGSKADIKQLANVIIKLDYKIAAEKLSPLVKRK